MAYDALAESVALIAAGRAGRVLDLSRRRRHAPTGVDVVDGVAVTTFVRRGAGTDWHETHQLVLRGGGWSLLGGGSASCEAAEVLADRAAMLPVAPLPGWLPPSTAPQHVAVGGSGGVRDERGRDGRWPWSGRWLCHAEVLVGASVARLVVGGRPVEVPWHGRVPVTWTQRRPPRAVALDATGAALGHVDLPGR